MDEHLMDGRGNGWNEWSKHVLAELERLNEQYEKITNEIQRVNSRNLKVVQDLRVELATLKVKASIWGATAGMVPVVVLILLKTVGI